MFAPKLLAIPWLVCPPAGIDPLIWRQAILDNPDSDKYLPVPMIGFTELHNRLKQQESQTKLHQAKLNVGGAAHTVSPAVTVGNCSGVVKLNGFFHRYTLRRVFFF